MPDQETPARNVPRFTVVPTEGGSRTLPAPESAETDPAPIPNVTETKETDDAGQS